MRKKMEHTKNKLITVSRCCKKEIRMIKLNDKKIKELILSGKNLKQSEFDTIRNRSEEFKNIVFRKNRKCLVQS